MQIKIMYKCIHLTNDTAWHGIGKPEPIHMHLAPKNFILFLLVITVKRV